MNREQVQKIYTQYSSIYDWVFAPLFYPRIRMGLDRSMVHRWLPAPRPRPPPGALGAAGSGGSVRTYRNRISCDYDTWVASPCVAPGCRRAQIPKLRSRRANDTLPLLSP